ncbi:MAG TPA: SRPBCC domain-containing protein [Rhizomicrobium sp.]|jgi:uncharacterized protein YndB with AHSA1/START domain
MNAPIIETPIRLSLTRSFDISPDLLFDAWLSPDFGEWLGTEGMACLSCEIDPRVGGQWKMLHRMPDGQTLDHYGVYKQIDRPSGLTFTWSGGCGGPNVTLVTIVFKAKGAGTEMTLTHEGFLGTEDAERHESGWIASFDRLARYLG